MKTGFRPGGRAGLQNGHMRPAGWAHRAKISSAARSAAGGAPMGRPKVCHMRFVSPDMLPAHVPRHHWRPPGGSVPRHAVAGSGWGILGIFHSGHWSHCWRLNLQRNFEHELRCQRRCNFFWKLLRYNSKFCAARLRHAPAGAADWSCKLHIEQQLECHGIHSTLEQLECGFWRTISE